MIAALDGWERGRGHFFFSYVELEAADVVPGAEPDAVVPNMEHAARERKGS